MFPVERVHELVRRAAITPAEGAEILCLNRVERHARALQAAVEGMLLTVGVIAIVAALACGPTAEPPNVDASVTAGPPTEPPPPACLPWPCR